MDLVKDTSWILPTGQMTKSDILLMKFDHSNRLEGRTSRDYRLGLQPRYRVQPFC